MTHDTHTTDFKAWPGRWGDPDALATRKTERGEIAG